MKFFCPIENCPYTQSELSHLATHMANCHPDFPVNYLDNLVYHQQTARPRHRKGGQPEPPLNYQRIVDVTRVNVEEQTLDLKAQSIVDLRDLFSTPAAPVIPVEIPVKAEQGTV
ncbi:hypothetical protein J8273_1210 [Carpediemonas membranifera]|uniref:Uncharacterized protein n=1 Tax=Carpediemonas membranifera TaxID=201153 RepID=A0A8J6B1I6_9EUKA|nr:hypothetical protein J8273_1210 [Carpediemonas membranifera]|eukprot:KAG9397295.1 hypothetical protein J8273_1210 [Carpediemonas membranifera]